MRKIVPLMIVTVCGLFLWACTAQSAAESTLESLQEANTTTFATTQPEETESAPKETTIEPTMDTMPPVVYEKYDIYELGTEYNDTTFNTAIDGNPLDAAYLQELNTANTTAEMMAVEQKYAALWQEELEAAVANYTAVLSQEDAQAFLEVQEMFTQYETATYVYDSALVLNNKYDIRMGSQAHQLLLAEKRETIRERTIHVKYLHYIQERAAGVTQYTSLHWEQG